VRLTVVGAGVVGSSVAILARESGHDVTVIADPDRPPASWAALCVFKPAWQRGPDRDAAEWTLGYYRERGMLTTGQVSWTSYRRPDGPQLRDGYYAVDPTAPLVVPDVAGQWPDVDLTADVTVLCRGAYSDAPGSRAHGVTSVWQDGTRPASRGHEDRPRNALYAVSHDGRTVRFGSSVARDARDALTRQIRDEAKASAVGIIPEGTPERIAGVRLMPEPGQRPLQIVQHGASVWSIEGAGRVGYSLAPARADEFLRTIGARP